MSKIMIISAGSIHTFDRIKEAAEYKFKFLCHYKPDREVKDEYFGIRISFERNPVLWYKQRRGDLSPVVIEEMLMNLTIAGINISDYFSSVQQDKYKAGFCGERCYKAAFKAIRKRMAVKSKKIEMAETPSFLRMK
nr:MAG TPA: hypothetical protein [Caudoviricetes sp.]